MILQLIGLSAISRPLLRKSISRIINYECNWVGLKVTESLTLLPWYWTSVVMCVAATAEARLGQSRQARSSDLP